MPQVCQGCPGDLGAGRGRLQRRLGRSPPNRYDGEQIAANKVAGARCALAYSTETAQLARQHNDANLVSVGARMHDLQSALGLVVTFLDTPFSGDLRHQRRIDLLTAYEAARA